MAASGFDLVKAARKDAWVGLAMPERAQPPGLGSFPWEETGLPGAGQRAWSPVAERLLGTALHHEEDGHDHYGEGFEAGSSTFSSTEDSAAAKVEAIRTVSASGDQGIDGLLVGRCWADGAITYCDPDALEDYTSPYPKALVAEDGTVLISQLSLQQLAAARFALDADPFGRITVASAFAVEGFTGLSLSYAGSGSGAGTIAMVNHAATATASAYYPNDALSGSGGDAYFGKSGVAPVVGNYDWKVVLHELGHALGLKHGQETSVYGAMPTEIDSMEYSVMTYRSYVGDTVSGYGNETWGYAQTFMMYDIAALQGVLAFMREAGEIEEVSL